MNGSSCPTCGWVLRWLPEQNAWGCDRCRKLVPQGAAVAPAQAPQPPLPQQPQQPSPYAPGGAPPGAPYQPQPAHAAGPPAPHAPPYGYGAPPRKSSKGLVIGLVVGAIAAAGIVVAVVVASGGGGGGAGSRDGIAKAAIAALGAHDVDKLLGLSDPVAMFNKALDCSERDKDKAEKDKDKDKDPDDGDKDKDDDDGDRDDPAMQQKRLRRTYEKLVDKMKDTKIELVSVVPAETDKDKDADDKDKDADDDDRGSKRKRRDSGVMKKGERAMKGCVFRHDVRSHDIVAKVKVTEGSGEPVEQDAKMHALEVDGTFFLFGPPELRAGTGGLEAKLRKYRDQMCACKDTACSDAVHKDYKEWTRGQRDAAKELSPSERRPLDKIDDELRECRRKLREAGAGDDDLGRAALEKMTQLKERMCACSDRACTDRVSKEMTEWAMANKDAKMPTDPATTRKVTEISEEMAKCMTRAASGGSDPDVAAPPPPRDPRVDDPLGGGGDSIVSVPSCAEYKKQIEKVEACPKFPPTAVATIRDGFKAMEKSWATLKGNAQARAQLGKSCEMIVESLKKSIATACP